MKDGNTKDNSIQKAILLEFIDYIRYKIESGGLTVSEIDSIFRAVTANVRLTGTAEDFAKFYHQPKENVKVVISRKVVSKPDRKVLYPFDEFRDAAPEKWRKKSNG